MNVAAMGALALQIYVERTLPQGRRVAWLAALVLVVQGLAAVIHPAVLLAVPAV